MKTANFRRTAALAACFCGLGGLIGGCETGGASQPADSPTANVRSIDIPAGTAAADRDRAYLARLIGAWQFDGWFRSADGARQELAGRSAGTIERNWFLLMDFEFMPGDGDSNRERGSLLLASEPGAGLTGTTWFSTRPVVGRFAGDVSANGTVFSLDEIETVGGEREIRIKIRMLNDDGFTMTFYELGRANPPVIGEWTFRRG